MAGFIDNQENGNSSWARILKSVKNIGSFGMEYKDLVIKNSQAIGMTEAGMRERAGFSMDDEEFIYSLAAQDTSNRKYIAYYDKDYPFQREFLRSFALNAEIEWILDILTDEAIVYDDKNFFCSLSTINLDLKDDVIKSLRKNFRKIYMMHGFTNGTSAWQYFKQLLIDGFLCFEIVYSNDGKDIVGFKELDPLSVVYIIERQMNGEMAPVWYQYYGDSVRQRKLYDSQVIYISYAKSNTMARVSYTQRLVRSHNLLKIMEHTRIIWNVMNSQFRLKMTIPVGSRSPQKAKETLGELMSVYKEDVRFSSDTGEISVNGKPNLQFYKNYLFPVMNAEQPKIETINGTGPNLNVVDVMAYFFNKLKLDSKIPFNRFAARSGGAVGTYKVGAESAERDEIRYSKFITRIRSVYQELIIKPLWIQMTLDHPELANDTVFKSQLGIKFNSDNHFGESREIEQMLKSIDFITAIGDLKEKKGDVEEPFFDQDFLIHRYLGLSVKDLELNEAYKRKEEEEGKLTSLSGVGSGSTYSEGEAPAPPTTETPTGGGGESAPATEGEPAAPAATEAPEAPAATEAPAAPEEG